MRHLRFITNGEWETFEVPIADLGAMSEVEGDRCGGDYLQKNLRVVSPVIMPWCE